VGTETVETHQLDKLELLLKEVNQRVIRTETRVVNLGDHIGLNLREQTKVELTHEGSELMVRISALDVSISQIMNVLHRAGCDRGRHVGVWCGGKFVCTVVAP